MAPIAHLLKPKSRDIGEFEVKRVLPAIEARSVGPFVFFDHFGPVDIAPGGGMNVRPHPHIGLATVSYLFEGGILHRDSLGYVQPIAPGDVNWMTAGRGIVHSERTEPEMRARGFRLHGVQSWVALPKAHEETEPAFRHHPGETLPRWQDGDVRLTLIAGTGWGRESPVGFFAPIFYADAEFPPGATLDLPAEHEECAVYPALGAVTIDGEDLPAGQMAVLTSGKAVTLKAGSEGARVILLGGAAVDGPRHLWWNFVSSSKDRIEQAKEEWRAMAYGTVPGDDGEFIPLPER